MPNRPIRMTDDMMPAFLMGLQVKEDPLGHTSIYDSEGNQIAQVFYTYGRRCVSAGDYAQAIVAAAHEYARFAEVIAAVKRVRGAYDAMMEKIRPPDERWQKLADEMQALQDIIYYRLPGDADPKEAADA